MLVDVFDKVYLLLRGIVCSGGFGVESRFYGLVAVLLVFGLIASAFLVPMVDTWSEVCSTCGGDGVHSCRQCGGSGVCWVCEGTGSIWYMPGDGWCAFCQGTGRCRDCGGDGVVTCETCYGSGSIGYWVYNVFGSSVVLSVLNVFLFVSLFVLDYIFNGFYLGFNTWVYGVKDMGFWFNRSFWIWLFATDRRRWVKWTSGFGAFGAVYVGALTFWLFSVNNITGDVLAGGVLVSVFSTGLFAWLFYKYYTSRKPETPPRYHEPYEERDRGPPFLTRYVG